jgi:hypothetical protein
MLGRPNWAGAGVHEELRRGVIEDIRGAGADEGDVVDDPAVWGKSSLTHMPLCAVLAEGAPGAEQVVFLNELSMNANRLPSRYDGGMGWPLSGIEARLVVEQLELGRAAGHEEVDDVLRPGGKMPRRGARGLGWSRWISGLSGVTFQQGREGDAAEAERAALKRNAGASPRRARRKRGSGASFAGDGFVEVEQHAGDGLPGSRGFVAMVAGFGVHELRREAWNEAVASPGSGRATHS